VLHALCRDPATGERKSVYCNAIWDTGASLTAVSQRVISELGLEPYEPVNIQTVGRNTSSNVYFASLSLPGNVYMDCIAVTKVSIDDTVCDIIIGMNVIGKGDFAVSGFGGETVFSYRHPPRQAIDFERYDYARIPLPADSGD
jgi:hypothetical protein